MTSFTPFTALAGGALIGLAASMLLLSHGQVAGISGLFASTVDPRGKGRSVAAWFVGGLLLAGVAARFLRPSALPAATYSLAMAGVAGLLVGVGTRLGSGCTSGHGVCGMSRLSKRSIVATLTFMATGVLTVVVLRALGGPS
jgi:uncharacterized membrane protein YedE/YeeE